MNWVICPDRKSTTQMPHFKSAFEAAATGKFPNKLLLRSFERPTKAKEPANASPLVKPGICATVVRLPLGGSTVCNWPVPDSRTQSRPSYKRGECGIDNPR